MNERERTSPDVLAERIRNLDRLHKAHELELHDLRTELHASLRANYLTTAEMRNVFVTRDELHQQRTVRREWPLIAAGVIVAACSVCTLVLAITGAH